jgi:hypothetical protein
VIAITKRSNASLLQRQEPPRRQPNTADPFGRLLCRNHDQHLALRAASSLARSWPADEDLIDLDDTLQPLTSGTGGRALMDMTRSCGARMKRPRSPDGLAPTKMCT